MLEVKKVVARLSMVCSLTLIAHTKTEAKNIPINLQEAIKIALKDNLAIQIAQNSKKESIIANNKATFQMWAPKATLKVMQRNSWQTNIAQHKLHAEPVLQLEWTFKSLADQIFETKINCQNNFIDRLVAKKTVEETLQEVVSAYYALALAQKKWELSNNFIKTATTRLKVEEEKFRLGLISKIDCLDAQLALKQVKLTLLKRQEDLKGKRRSFNLILGKPLTEETLVHSTISPQPIWNIKGITKEKIIDLKTDIASKKVALAQTKLSRAQAYPLTCLSLSGSFHSNGYIYDLKNKTSDPAKTASKWLSHIGISIDIGKLLLMPTTITKAKIALNNEKLALQQQKSAIEGGLEDKKWKYRDALALHKVVEEQLKISKQKLVFVKEKYRLNQVKLLELHEAEEAAQKIEIDLIEQAFKVRQAEFDLYRLIGMFHEK